MNLTAPITKTLAMFLMLVVLASLCQAQSLQDMIKDIQRQKRGEPVESAAPEDSAGTISGARPVRFAVNSDELQEACRPALVGIGTGERPEDFQLTTSGIFITEQGHLLAPLSSVEKLEQPVVLLSDLTILPAAIVAEFPEQRVALLQIETASPTAWVEIAADEDPFSFNTLYSLSVGWVPPAATTSAEEAQAGRSAWLTAQAVRSFTVNAESWVADEKDPIHIQSAQPVSFPVDFRPWTLDGFVLGNEGRVLGLYQVDQASQDGQYEPLLSLRSQLPASAAAEEMVRYRLDSSALQDGAREALVLIAGFVDYGGWRIARYATGYYASSNGMILTTLDAVNENMWGWAFDVNWLPVEEPATPTEVPINLNPLPGVDRSNQIRVGPEIESGFATPTPSQVQRVEAQQARPVWSSSQGSAEKLRLDRLASAPSDVVQRDGVSDAWCVRFGPFNSQQEAAEQMSKIQSEGYQISGPLWREVRVGRPRLYYRDKGGIIYRAAWARDQQEPINLALLRPSGDVASLRYLPQRLVSVKTGGQACVTGGDDLDFDIVAGRSKRPEELLSEKAVEMTMGSGKVKNPVLDLERRDLQDVPNPRYRGVELDVMSNVGWKGGPILDEYGRVIATVNEGRRDIVSPVVGCWTGTVIDRFSGLAAP